MSVERIRQGDRGPAVEDVQRRLITLGHELGMSGVDGVFLGATLAAVIAFQREHKLSEDGIVGPETWSALVDATFSLGDRLLYLRFPYLHGNDVRVLQGALNALGFSCGVPDGIFGAFTERAVREFQLNTGQPVDGIAGPETVRAVTRLRHVWTDKGPEAPVALRASAARAADVLSRAKIALLAEDEVGRDVAGRVVNLAIASDEQSCLSIAFEGEPAPDDADAVLHLRRAPDGPPPTDPHGMPIVRLSEGRESSLAARIVTAFAGASGGRPEAVVEVEMPDLSDERALQRSAVGFLDALCSALASGTPSVLP